MSRYQALTAKDGSVVSSHRGGGVTRGESMTAVAATLHMNILKMVHFCCLTFVFTDFILTMTYFRHLWQVSTDCPLENGLLLAMRSFVRRR